MVARSLAIVHTCIFDAWAAYDRLAVGTRLGPDLRRPPGEHTLAHKAEAVSFAAYRALTDVLAGSAALFEERMRTLGYDAANATTDVSTPAGIGNVACRAVLEHWHHDGSNQLGDLAPGAYSDYTGYTPVNDPERVNDPDRWQPLRVPNGTGGFETQRFIGPHWSRVRPFALTSSSQFGSPTGPPRYGSPEYVRQAEELLELSANLTDREKMIAEYWVDGPNSELPPGHWNYFAQFVSRRDSHGIDADVKMFFALNNALHDAAIAAWDNKRAYDSVRPITAIRFLFDGRPVRAWGGPYRGTQVIDGGDWLPYQPESVVTPAFPEYTSGHSTFSAAAAEVLKRFTGSDHFGDSTTMAAGSSRYEPGAVPATDVTLRWDTFSAAADEAGLSRRYGGIHFAPGDLDGRAAGRGVGAQAWSKSLTYVNGTSVTCGQLSPTITGTPGNDVITGTAGNDVIAGLAGDDRISGGGGYDILCGGDGNDALDGDGGPDAIFGSTGHDTVNGGAGSDYLAGGSGYDRIRGGAANDVLLGEGDTDALYGEEGDDQIFGGHHRAGEPPARSSDALYGGPGNDVLSGQGGNDWLDGGPHAGWPGDRCDGGTGTDLARRCEATTNVP